MLCEKLCTLRLDRLGQQGTSAAAQDLCQRIGEDPWLGELDDVSLTSPIRPAVPEFSPGKSLNGKERGGQKRRKSAVVPTKSILSAANVPIIGGHHVLALQSSPEGWQATSLSERCRE